MTTTSTKQDFIPVNPPEFKNEKILHQVEAAVDENKSVLLTGDTGVGKTTCARWIAAKRNMGFRRFSIHGGTTNDEVIGKILLNESGTFFVDGVLLDAMKKGYILLLDEINFARAEVLASINSLLDDDNFLVVAENNGELVRPHEDFRLLAAMNPGYAGTKQLNLAFMSRFWEVIHFDYLPEDEEIELLMERTNCTRQSATAKVKVVNNIRRTQGERHGQVPCSFRELMNWTEVEAKLGDQNDAFVVTIVNKCGPEEREALFDAYRTVAGTGF